MEGMAIKKKKKKKLENVSVSIKTPSLTPGNISIATLQVTTNSDTILSSLVRNYKKKKTLVKSHCNGRENFRQHGLHLRVCQNISLTQEKLNVFSLFNIKSNEQ
jgi:hypothetical protein